MLLRNSLVLVVGLGLAGQEIGPLLEGIQRRVPGAGAAAGVGHVRDVNSVLSYWSRPGVWAGGDRRYLDRSYSYLNAMQAYAANDPALAIAVASAYRQMALIQEPYAREASLAAYAASAQLYTRWVGVHPGLRSQLSWLSGRAYGLAGVVPAWGAAYYVKPLEGLDAVRANAQPQAVAPPPEMVAWPEGVQGPAELQDRFMTAATTVLTTHLAAQPVKESVAGLGQTLHPDTAKGLGMMQSMMELARSQVVAGKFDEARESVSRAEAYAKRAGKALGL